MHAKIPAGALSAAPLPANAFRRRSRCCLAALAPLPLAAVLAACQPTVRVEAPKDPITINLNIQADVRVTLEEKAREDIEANPDLF